MCSIHKGRVHIQFLDKTHGGKQGQTNLQKYVCFHLQDKPAVMKVKAMVEDTGQLYISSQLIQD